MKKIIILVLTIVLLVPVIVNTGCKKTMKVDNAKRRVSAILKGIQVKGERGDTVGDEETAICQWWSGKHRISDQQILNSASDGFDQWRKEMDIFPYIDDYTIENAVMDGDDVIVFVTINHMPMTLRVPDGDRVTWTDYIVENGMDDMDDD